MSRARVRRRYLAAVRYQMHCDRHCARNDESQYPLWAHVCLPSMGRLYARVPWGVRVHGRQLWHGVR